ncbi:MAG: hypothetical protein AAF636_03445 [Pseudomonadota bacterium]
MSDVAHPQSAEQMRSQPVDYLDGGRLIVRGFQLLIGAAMLIAALGVWFSPGASWAHELVLMKLLVSSVAFLTGLAFLQMSFRPDAPKVEIDTIQHEVRLVRSYGRDRFVLDRCRFADLSRVVESDTHVQLWGRKGTLLAEVAVEDRLSHRNLVTALRVAGKL